MIVLFQEGENVKEKIGNVDYTLRMDLGEFKSIEDAKKFLRTDKRIKSGEIFIPVIMREPICILDKTVRQVSQLKSDKTKETK